MAAELLTATVMFTDVARSTAQRAALGDERADEVRRAHDEIVRAVVDEHDGAIVKGGGDGFVVRFSSAVHAIECAVGVQRGVSRWSASLTDTDVELRIGVSSGDVSLEDGDIFGLPVVESARLEAAAEPGEILCAGIVRMLVGSRAAFAFTDRGSFDLKGLPEPLAAFAVDWSPDDSTSPAVALPARPDRIVGRDEVVADLERWSRDGAAVIVDAHAGGGKTTVLNELAHRLAATHTVLHAAASAVDATPFATVRALLRPIRDRLPADLWKTTDRDGLDHSARIALLESVRDGVASIDQSMVAIVDDAHWLDNGSADVLRSLAPLAGGSLTMIVGLRGAEADPGGAISMLLDALRRQPRCHDVELGPLTDADVRALAVAIGGVPNEIVDAVIERSGGVPLFAAELLDGQRDVDDLPASVHTFVERRMRELDPDVAELIRVAALLPEPFEVESLAQVAERPPRDVLAGLDRAEAVGVLSVDRGEVRFRHALVRDAVAESTDASARSTWAAAGARHYAATSDGAVIAADLADAAGPMLDRDEAIGIATAAGESARRLLAFEDAADRFARAAALAGSEPDQRRLELLRSQASCLLAAWRWNDARPVLAEVCDVARSLDRGPDEVDAALDLFGEPENFQWGEPMSDRVARALEVAGLVDAESEARLHAGPMIVAGDAMDVERYNELAARARQLAAGSPAASFVARAQLRSNWSWDQVDERRDLVRSVIADSEARRDDEVLAYGHRWAVVLAIECGQLNEATAHLDAMDFLASRLEHAFHRWFVITRRAILCNARGELDESQRQMAKASALSELMDTPYVRTAEQGIRHGLYYGSGRVDPAMSDGATHPIWSAVMAALRGDPSGVGAARGALDVLPRHGLARNSLLVLSPVIAAAVGEADLGARLLNELDPYRGGHLAASPAAGYLGAVEHATGLCNFAAGRLDEAIIDFDRAGEIERAVGASLRAFHSDWFAQALRRRRGDVDVARDAALEEERRRLGIERIVLADVAGLT